MWMSSQISGGAAASKPGKPELRSIIYHPNVTGGEKNDVQGLSPSMDLHLHEGEMLGDIGFELCRGSSFQSQIELCPVDVRR